MHQGCPIIILDEATANVDSEKEYHFQHAIRQLTRSKTIIMTDYRLKTARDVDQIQLLEDGKII